MKAKDIKIKEDDVVAQLILMGDLSRLQPAERVTYYRGYCERIGLDPFTKPFDILRLNGKEVLYLTRSGAQQLNKLHGVSHTITARDIVGGEIYQVTARATLPDGRHSESIGAVPIAGYKGEAYCNQIMKAETKAKRRCTLDLLGLGILSEEEVVTLSGGNIANHQSHIPVVEAEVLNEPQRKPVDISELPFDDQIRLTYETADKVARLVAMCQTVQQLLILYKANQKIAETPEIKRQFEAKKQSIFSQSK